MRFVFFTHSLVSDWNHGNAHFLRGVMRELVARGHRATAWEPRDGWSRANLERDQGALAVARFFDDFPSLEVQGYSPGEPPDAAVASADVVIVHEWTDPAVVAAIGRLRRDGGRFLLLFHGRAAGASCASARPDSPPRAPPRRGRASPAARPRPAHRSSATV
jgi:spore maturation protein CgeB